MFPTRCSPDRLRAERGSPLPLHDRRAAPGHRIGTCSAPLQAAARPTSVLRLVARDEIRRDRFTLDPRLQGRGLHPLGPHHLFYQAATTPALMGNRNTAADRRRDSHLDNAVWGFPARNSKAFRHTGAVRHHHLALIFPRPRRPRCAAGVVPPARAFPTRAFPDTDYLIAGVFARDEIALLDQGADDLPGAALDYYRLGIRARPTRSITAPRRSIERHPPSPKLGLVWRSTTVSAVFLINLAEASAGARARPGEHQFRQPDPELRPRSPTPIRAPKPAAPSRAASATATWLLVGLGRRLGRIRRLHLRRFRWAAATASRPRDLPVREPAGRRGSTASRRS